MTMAEGMLGSGGAVEGRLSLDLCMPWYRSLPLSCLEEVSTWVDGAPTGLVAVAVPGFVGTLDDAAASDAVWDLRDPLVVTVDRGGVPGEVVAVDVDVAIRIPYLQLAPGVAFVQRASTRREVTIS